MLTEIVVLVIILVVIIYFISQASLGPLECPAGHTLGPGALGVGFCYKDCNSNEETIDGGVTCRRKCPDGYSENILGNGCNSKFLTPCPEGTNGIGGLCQKNIRMNTPLSLLTHGACPDGIKFGVSCVNF